MPDGLMGLGCEGMAGTFGNFFNKIVAILLAVDVSWSVGRLFVWIFV